MKQSYPNRDWVWLFLNSRWAIVSVMTLGVLSFMSFLYIGFKVNNKKWKIYGIIYAIALFGLGFNDLLDWIFKALIFTSTIHTIAIHKKYLIKLNELQS